MEAVKKVKKTFGLAVLLKIAGIHPVEEGGYYLIPNFREAGQRVARAVEKYNIKLVVA